MADADDVFNSDAAGETGGVGTGDSRSAGEGAGTSDGEGGVGECGLGCRSPAEEAAALETARGHAKGDSVRRVDRYSGFRRAVTGEDRYRVKGWISAYQGEGQARVGCECAGTHSVTVGGYHAQLRCEFGLYARPS